MIYFIVGYHPSSDKTRLLLNHRIVIAPIAVLELYLRFQSGVNVSGLGLLECTQAGLLVVVPNTTCATSNLP